MVAMSGKERRGKRKGKWHDNCDCLTCDCPSCELPFCDLGLVSTVLLLVSKVSRTGRNDRAVLAAIRGYRRVSPRLPTRCRYTPTCSAYGLQAVERYGTRAGLRLTMSRLRRCRPGVAYGTADPVP
jgi:putative membrane protein insertion efficiency factor